MAADFVKRSGWRGRRWRRGGPHPALGKCPGNVCCGTGFITLEVRPAGYLQLDEDQLTAAYELVIEKYRRLDIVINNAAVLGVSEKCFKKMIDVNFTGTVYSTTMAVEAMGVKKGGVGGTVVNISSLLAMKIGTHLPVYAATKTAILQYSVSMGSEENYKKTGVRVLTVCLGPTDTAILHRNNLQNLDQTLTSRVPDRQRVESAVNGILQVINQGASGSTWLVEADKPAYNFSNEIAGAFQTL